MNPRFETVYLESIAYPAALGAGVAYSMYGTRPIPLAVGAVGGYFAYGPVQTLAVKLPLPPLVTLCAPEMLAGGLIGYNLYGGLIYTAVGAAAGIAVKYAVASLLAKELGTS